MTTAKTIIHNDIGYVRYEDGMLNRISSNPTRDKAPPTIGFVKNRSIFSLIILVIDFVDEITKKY